MKINRIYEETAALCREGRVEERAVFCAALNRALSEVGRLSPEKKRKKILHDLPEALFSLQTPRRVSSGEPLTVKCVNVSAVALSGFGEGAVTVLVDGIFCRTLTLTGEFDHRLLLSSLCEKERGEVTLLFTSERTLALETLALYGCLFSRCEEVPMGNREILYPMGDDFLGFTGELFKDGRAILEGAGLCLSDKGVFIDRSMKGIYEVGYYAAPQEISETMEEEELYLEKNCEHLLLLLTAYYLSLEDDDGRCEEYLARYREALAAYKKGLAREDERLIDRYGW